MLFGFNGPNTIRKQSYWASIAQGGLKLPFSGQKWHFWTMKIQVLCPFGLLNAFFHLITPVKVPKGAPKCMSSCRAIGGGDYR